MSEQLLLRTVHGSRLYGTHHENSDYDYLEVYANKVPSPAKYIKQSIKGTSDVIRMNLSTFSLYACRSSHQILEAMYSEKCEVDLITDYRKSFLINTGTFVPLYMRTIKKFEETQDLKKNRQAVRLALNMREGLYYGKFDPTLDPDIVKRLLSASVEELIVWKNEILDNL